MQEKISYFSQLDAVHNKLISSEIIHHRILLHIAPSITKLLYYKMLKPALLLMLKQTQQFLLEDTFKALRWEISQLASYMLVASCRMFMLLPLVLGFA